MEFEIACTCGQHMLVEARYVGQEVECPGCGGLLAPPATPRPGDPVPVVAPVPSTSPPPPEARPCDPSGPPPTYVEYGAGRVQPTQTHARAVAALIFSILGMSLCPLVVPSIIGLVLAAQAKREIEARPDLYTGTGIATAAQVCGVIGVLGLCLVWGCPLLVLR